MSKFAWLIGAAGVGLMWLCAPACVADDPASNTSNAPAPGEFRGPCVSSACNPGLVCLQNVCLYAGDAAGPGDGSATDAAIEDANAAGDATPTPGVEPCPVTGIVVPPTEVSCPMSGSTPPPCVKGNTCCVGGTSNSCVADPTTCVANGAKPFGCGGKDTCDSGEVCCLEMDNPLTNPKLNDACPRTIKSGFKAAQCRPNKCALTDTRICRDSSECGGSSECRRVLLETVPGTITLGVCL